MQIWHSSLKRFQYHFCWCFEFIWINSLTGVLEYHRNEVTMILREIQWPRCWEKKFFACSNDEERAEERAPFGKWLSNRILLFPLTVRIGLILFFWFSFRFKYYCVEFKPNWSTRIKYRWTSPAGLGTQLKWVWIKWPNTAQLFDSRTVSMAA